MKHFLLVPIFLIFSLESEGMKWSPNELQSYSQRRFIYLEHLLVERGDFKAALKISSQERRLSGCRILHHGRGGVDAIVLCVGFLNEEQELGLTSSGSAELIEDVNTLCQRLVGKSDGLERLLSQKTFGNAKQNKKWRPCIGEAWRQVYLTAYANFEADPVGTLSFIHRAESALPPQGPWTAKVKDLIGRR